MLSALRILHFTSSRCKVRRKLCQSYNRDKEFPIICALCSVSGNHSANYKGCSKYKKIFAKPDKSTIHLIKSRLIRKSHNLVLTKPLIQLQHPTPISQLLIIVLHNLHKVKVYWKNSVNKIRLNLLASSNYSVSFSIKMLKFQDFSLH